MASTLNVFFGFLLLLLLLVLCKKVCPFSFAHLQESDVCFAHLWVKRGAAPELKEIFLDIAANTSKVPLDRLVCSKGK